jgi:hypothetical protein
MLSRVCSFQESAKETLYEARSTGSERGPMPECRHPVANKARTQLTKVRVFDIGVVCLPFS